MFIRKTTKLKNVGKFRNSGISGGEYQRFTLFYAGNGRGKSTLCSVLRSLQSGDQAEIEVRKSFGATSGPEAQFLLDTGVASYPSGGAGWSATAADMHIFDGKYVSDNVYGGDHVAVEQRRNIYRIAVGERGVALATEIDRLDAEIAAKQAAITAHRQVVQQHVPRGNSFDIFEMLAADEGIEGKIAAAAARLKAAGEAASIAARAASVEVSLPALPARYEDLLARGLDGVSADATRLVSEQIERHLFQEHGHTWLSDGLAHVADDRCPFCGQAVAGLPLLEAYKGYFSRAYTDLGTDLRSLSAEVDKVFGEAAAMRLAEAIAKVGADAEYWATYFAVAVPQVGAAAGEAMERMRQAAHNRLVRKLSSPLDTIASTEEFEEARRNWDSVVEQLGALNTFVVGLNQSAGTLKAETARADVAAIEREVAGLEAIQKRHSDPVGDLFSAHSHLLREKDTLVEQKTARKDELDAYDATVLASYEAEINGFLTQFGAGFTLSRTTKNYMGGTPQSSYCIKFGNGEIDAADQGRGGNPSFSTTMSAGDKSTLALAVFLAQVRRDALLGQKVLVYDDPFTSLDEFRREMTAKTIVRLGLTASQTIVFSHDKYFLDAVKGKIRNVAVATMQISTSGGNSSLVEWDIDREVRDGYLQAHMSVVEFVQGHTNDAAAIRTVLRPLLESYIRYRFPNQIPDGMWLGDMLGIIRTDPNHPLTSAYNDLDDINGYTAPFHHDASTPFDADEVKTFAVRTLTIVGGN